jgi:hypothetical protein
MVAVSQPGNLLRQELIPEFPAQPLSETSGNFCRSRTVFTLSRDDPKYIIHRQGGASSNMKAT